MDIHQDIMSIAEPIDSDSLPYMDTQCMVS